MRLHKLSIFSSGELVDLVSWKSRLKESSSVKSLFGRWKSMNTINEYFRRTSKVVSREHNMKQINRSFYFFFLVYGRRTVLSRVFFQSASFIVMFFPKERILFISQMNDDVV